MQDNIQNRQSLPAKRGGRPTNAEVERRPAPIPVETVTIPITGIRCLHCGKGMMPRILRTTGLQRTVSCSLCGKCMVMVYTKEGIPAIGRCI